MNKVNTHQQFKKRPINLRLTSIHFPLPAIVSILHRVSGFVLFLLIPLFLWLLQSSLASEQSFNTLVSYLVHPCCKFIAWVFLSLLIYHFVAGIRHLLMDLEIGESLRGGRLGALLVMVISAILIVLLGIWIW